MKARGCDVSQSNQTRTRSGCLNCRYRKRKCDEVRPQCSHCRQRGKDCCYGTKASFHPSRELRLSAEDETALLRLESQRYDGQSSIRFVDNTAQIVSEYENPLGRGLLQPTEPSEERSYGTNTPCEQTEYPHNIGNDNSNDRSRAGNVLNTSAPPVEASITENIPAVGTQFVAPSYFDVELPISKTEQSQLIRAYLQETGMWCEITDIGRHFTVSYVHPLMTNKPFAAAAMALTSRHQDAVRRSHRQSTLSLYQQAVQSLLYYEPSQCGEATLACCVILSMYEMMTSEPVEWRRHLKGCVFNLTNKGWNGSSRALVGASFWAFARLDVWASYMLKEETLLPPERWVDHEWIVAAKTVDNYCNLATLLLAKAVNLLASGPSNTPIDIADIWHNLQDWHAHRPSQTLPLLSADPGCGNPFPTILHTGDASICGNTFYHTACILLLRTGQLHNDASLIWHAKELCGISITSTSHASWVNQVYPLFIAGEVFGAPEEDREEHVAEKFALLKHLAKIEREIGWPTAGKAAELRRLWGLE